MINPLCCGAVVQSSSANTTNRGSFRVTVGSKTLVRKGSVSTPRRADQGSHNAAHGFDLTRRPAGLGEDGADRVLRGLGARGRMEIALAGQLLLELADKTVELAMRSGGL